MTEAERAREMVELAERVEKAECGSADLTADVYEALGYRVKRRPELVEGRWGGRGLGRAWAFLRDSRWEAMQPFTESLDAAMSLVPEGWFGRVEPRFYSDDGEVRWRAYAIKPDWSRWTPHDDWFEVVGEARAITAATPALALCAASLRARAHSTPGER